MALALVKLPKAWSNHDRVDQLTGPAYASATRMLSRAVAETGVNFNINSAYRSKAEQIALFRANYTNRGTRSKVASTDRMYAGTAWKHTGSVAVASPDLYGTGTGANHTLGIAIDIVPAAIQTWIQRNGPRFGWSWAEGKRNNEAWHFVYSAAGDQYRSEGTLDHAWVQRVVGASPVDGKIGTGTVAKIKAWQKAHGLEADGKVGPATKAAMAKGGTSGKGDAPAAGATPEKPAAPSKEPAATPGWMTGADQSQTWGGNPHKATVTKLVLHTTEGSGYTDYGNGGSAPHFTVKPGPADGDHIRQHIPTTEASKALENRSGGVETNNAGVVQVEIVGSCDRAYAEKNGLRCTEDYGDDDLASVAAVVAWVCEAHGIPLSAAGLAWPTTNAAYLDAPQRMSGEEWTEYAGICGHTHVPENVHWDPGAFPVARLLELAGGAPTTADPSTPTTDGGMPNGKDLLMALIAAPDFPLLRTDGHLCYFGPKTGPKESVSGHQANTLNPGDVGSNGSTGLKAWQKRMNARGYSLTVDGKYGDACAKAAKNLQKLAGITQDGLIGPDCWYAAWLLPVK
ncbi:peptidoglycan-binding protein [Brachybacterium subflavum]|uniref:peptidoglycan-binding protein n=1 Tax=Brachybacterium subflavum TaxID=2585206 RepID=UPI00187AB1FC|nr:peptidoglycan-binding protein [Brachybacterium subflavum]